MYSGGPFHMDEQRLDYQLEPIYNSSVPIQDEDLPGEMDDRDRWRERFRKICASSAT